jgi:hypothetical protein
MSDGVSFVLAIPILQPEKTRQFYSPNPVAAVVYIDSKALINDRDLQKVVLMPQQFLNALQDRSDSVFDHLRNVPLTDLCDQLPPREGLPENAHDTLELVAGVEPPKTSRPFQFNFDYSDFIPAKTLASTKDGETTGKLAN